MLQSRSDDKNMAGMANDDDTRCAPTDPACRPAGAGAETPAVDDILAQALVLLDAALVLFWFEDGRVRAEGAPARVARWPQDEALSFAPLFASSCDDFAAGGPTKTGAAFAAAHGLLCRHAVPVSGADGIAPGVLFVFDRVAPDGRAGATCGPHVGLLLDTVAGRLADRCALWRAGRENARLAAALIDGEARLRESRDAARGQRGQLDALLSAAPVGICYVDRAGGFTSFNDEVERLWGAFPTPSTVGEYVRWQGWWADHSARHGQPLAAEDWPLARALRGERVDNDVIRIQPFDGSPRRTVACRAAPVRDGAGAVLGAVITLADVTRQSEVEQALRLNEERFRSLVQATTQIVWIRDARGARAPDSPSWRAYTGQSVEAWTGDGWVEALHPDDRERVRAAWLASTAAQTPYEAEYRLRRADGSWRWTVARGHPITGGDGKVREWVGTNTDIHDRRLAERVSQEWRRRLEAILEAGDVGTWTLDLRRQRLTADANVARLVGMAPTLAPAAPLRLFLRAVHPDDVAAVRAGLARAIDQGEPYQLVHRIRRPDGAELTVNVRGRIEVDAGGAPVRLSGVALDVTRQVETERRLRSSETARLLGEERYRMVLDGVDVGFCIIEMLYDDAGEPCSYRILEANPAFAQHTGLFNAVGKTIDEILPSFDPRWARIYGRVARIGLPVRVEQHSFGLGRWMDVYASRIGEPARGQVALFLRDVTEERERNDTLQRLADNLADANRRQSEFLATLAHELRNPLAPVRTGLDLLRIGADAPAMLAKVRPMMERQVNHLVHLVDDLLDLARINSGKIELKKREVVLRDVVMRAVEMTQPAIAARRHAFELALADEDTRLFADPTRLAQVIGNLLTNAAKYTLEGGRILLAVRRDGDRVIVAVTDSGVGIPAEALPRIFDMFTQVGRHPEQEAGGLGIGLHLVRQMTERHGGTVRADSAGPGQGSRFVVELPVASAMVEASRDDTVPAPAAASAGAPEGRPLRILLADDNLDAADLLRDVLQMEGHRVEAVGNGFAALEAAGRVAPDVVLLDIGMPGMNGYEVARRLRAAPAGVDDMRVDVHADGQANGQARGRPALLVALTGWGAAEDRLKSREAGFDAHLTKPVDLDALRALIASRA